MEALNFMDEIVQTEYGQGRMVRKIYNCGSHSG
jgi:hypothetical protein